MESFHGNVTITSYVSVSLFPQWLGKNETNKNREIKLQYWEKWETDVQISQFFDQIMNISRWNRVYIYNKIYHKKTVSKALRYKISRTKIFVFMNSVFSMNNFTPSIKYLVGYYLHEKRFINAKVSMHPHCAYSKYNQSLWLFLQVHLQIGIFLFVKISFFFRQIFFVSLFLLVTLL